MSVSQVSRNSCNQRAVLTKLSSSFGGNRIVPSGCPTSGRTWTSARAEVGDRGRLDLLPVLEGISPVADAAAYAFSWITSPEERTVTLAFESDDDLRVWLNGTLVIDNEVARGVGHG